MSKLLWWPQPRQLALLQCCISLPLTPTCSSGIGTYHCTRPRGQSNTPHHGVRNIENPTLVWRFCTNDCMLYYCFLYHTIFTNTMFASTQFHHGNKCSQNFSSDFGWARTYSMALGKFHQKLQDASCEQKTQNLTPLDRMLQSMKSKTLRKGLLGSDSSPRHPADFGTIAWIMRPMSDHIRHTTYLT